MAYRAIPGSFRSQGVDAAVFCAQHHRVPEDGQWTRGDQPSIYPDAFMEKYELSSGRDIYSYLYWTNDPMHLLLLHGAIGAADQMTALAAKLQNDLTVHTLDFSGHGSRPFPQAPFSISLFAGDVLTYMDEHKLEQAAVFGYSMGGYVGMYLARYHSSRISRLGTLATKFHWDPAIAQRETQMINPDKIREKLPAFARTLEQRHHPKDWKTVLERTAHLLTSLGDQPLFSPDIYPAITIPVLLLLGDRDKMVSLDETLAVFKSLPNAQLGILPGTPHPIEQVNKDLLASQLQTFYRE